MEWLGINLNHHHAEKWLSQRLIRLLWIVGATLCSLSIAYFIWQQSQIMQHTNVSLDTELLHIQHKLEHTQQQITGLKSQHQNQQALPQLEKNTIQTFLQFLTALPLNGGLEFASLEMEEQPKIVLSGKLSAEHFGQLEHYFKQHHYHYRVEHLQSNELHLLEFTLSLFLPQE